MKALIYREVHMLNYTFADAKREKRRETYLVAELKDTKPTYKFILKQGIHDIGLSRVAGRYMDVGMLILSASTNRPLDRTQTEQDKINFNKSRELEKDIRAKGLGFVPTLGGYDSQAEHPEEIKYEDKDYYEIPKVENAEAELSYIVPYNPKQMSEEEFLKFGLEMCKKYNQECILVVLPSIENGQPVYMDRNTNVTMKFKKDFNIKTPEDPYYTKLRKQQNKLNKSFVFKAGDAKEVPLSTIKIYGIRTYSNPYEACKAEAEGNIL